jgi:O-antigen/teichoic acid export membrane protein
MNGLRENREPHLRDSARKNVSEAGGNETIRRVARGSIAAFAIYVVSIGLTYVSQLLIARMVGVDIYGMYAYVLAWMTVLAYFSALGFDVAILRFVPAYEAARDWRLLKGVIEYSQRRAAVVGTLVLLAGLLIVLFRAASMSIDLRNAFLVGLVLVPVWALLWIRCSVVRAFGGVVGAVAPDRLVRDGMLVGIVAVAAMALQWRLDAAELTLATLLSSLVGLALAGRGMRRLRPPPATDAIAAYAAATWRAVALPLVLIGAVEALMNRTGVLLLGWIGDTKAAGVYSMVFNIAFVVALPRTAVNILFAPAISSLHARNERIMLQALVARAAAWMLCAGASVAVVLAVFAGPLLAWFGPGFESGAPALRILLLAQVIVCGAGSQQHVLIMTGHERSAAAIIVSCATANAAGCMMLIGYLGVTGAAISTAATFILWNVVMAVFIWRRLRLNPGILAMLQFRFRSKTLLASKAPSANVGVPIEADGIKIAPRSDICTAIWARKSSP